jgi:hypothetical protein
VSASGRLPGPREIRLHRRGTLVEHAAGEYYQADVALFGKTCQRRLAA